MAEATAISTTPTSLNAALARFQAGLVEEIALAHLLHAEALRAHDHASARTWRRNIERIERALADVAEFRS